MKRVALSVALLLTLVLNTQPASANYIAHDARERAMTHLNIEGASSYVFRGSYAGFRMKLVRFRMSFYDSVPWRTLILPEVGFNLDSFGLTGRDYRLEIFFVKPVRGKRRLQCWLSTFPNGGVVLESKVFANGPRFATCTFPKRAIRVRANGSVRWSAFASYGSFYHHVDRAPNNPPLMFPHL